MKFGKQVFTRKFTDTFKDCDVVLVIGGERVKGWRVYGNLTKELVSSIEDVILKKNESVEKPIVEPMEV